MGHKGFVKLHRQILDSEIMNMPPVTRELWQYILLNAQHKPFKNLKEGELFMRFKDVQDALCWYVGYRKMTYKKYDLTRSIRRLCESNMIATTKATHGILVKVLNYSLYQGSENGESNNESLTKATRKQRSCININKNDKNVKNVNKNIYSQLFTHWINQDIYNHRKNIYQSEIKTALKKYNFDEIKNAITNYAIILKDEKYYFNYRWTLGDFLKRGIDRFIDLDIAKGNFLKNQKGGSNGNRKQLQQQSKPKTESEYDHLCKVYRTDT